MAGMMQIPRTRGAISGLLLMLLGAWGALIPFIGPYWHYTYTPDNTWDYTTGRLLLEVLPGVGAFLGGLLTLGSANRLTAMFGGWLAAVSGAWFIVGMPLSAAWGSPTVGVATGGTSRQAFEYIGFFGGLGAVIVFLAAFALGRFAVVGVRDVERAEARSTASGMPVDDTTATPTTAPTTAPTQASATPGAGDAYPADTADTADTTDATTSDGAHHRLHWPRSRHDAGAR